MNPYVHVQLTEVELCTQAPPPWRITATGVLSVPMIVWFAPETNAGGAIGKPSPMLGQVPAPGGGGIGLQDPEQELVCTSLQYVFIPSE